MPNLRRSERKVRKIVYPDDFPRDDDEDLDFEGVSELEEHSSDEVSESEETDCDEDSDLISDTEGTGTNCEGSDSESEEINERRTHRTAEDNSSSRDDGKRNGIVVLKFRNADSLNHFQETDSLDFSDRTFKALKGHVGTTMHHSTTLERVADLEMETEQQPRSEDLPQSIKDQGQGQITKKRKLNSEDLDASFAAIQQGADFLASARRTFEALHSTNIDLKERLHTAEQRFTASNTATNEEIITLRQELEVARTRARRLADENDELREWKKNHKAGVRRVSSQLDQARADTTLHRNQIQEQALRIRELEDWRTQTRRQMRLQMERLMGYAGL